MRAMLLESANTPLVMRELSPPKLQPHQVRVDVKACGVCRTDLHIVDGELDQPNLPLIPGHQIVGTISEIGEGVSRFALGDRIGIAWLGATCGSCLYCSSQRENLCGEAKFTGYDINGGYADSCVADAGYCFVLPSGFADSELAPLLCAGLIGYRALRMAGDAKTIGFYGFGAAAHILVQLAKYQGRNIFAFTRTGDKEAQDFALETGAIWSGSTEEFPPQELDAAIIFAPAGQLVPVALRHLARGGVVVCAGIHMSDIPAFPYELLWGERTLKSVSNLTRRDGEEFFDLVPKIPIRTKVRLFPLVEANSALQALRQGSITGAAVLA